MGLFETLKAFRTYRNAKHMRVVSSFIHPDINKLMGMEARGWKMGMGALADSGVPMGGLGFAGIPLPNSEPVNAPTAVTGVSVETNLYTPGISTNADWALLPQGSIRAPQSWLVYATGIFSTSVAAQTFLFTSRLGTSATPSSNQTLGATGLLNPNGGATITNGLWTYVAQMTIRGPGTSATAISTADITLGTTTPPVTAVGCGLSGNTTATFDATLQQGYVISVTPSNAGASIQLTQFCLIAVD